MSSQKTMRKNKKGYTLVELIVVFAMIGIFMVSLTTVSVSYMKTFLRVTATGKTQIAADTVMETIAGELSAAANRPVQDDDGNLTDHSLEVWGSSVRYVNQNGQTILMTAEDGILHLHYLEIPADAAGAGSAAADWFIGEDAYQGARIETLTFTPIVKEKRQLIKVSLVMSNEKVSADYRLESTKIVEMYNLRQ